MKKWFLLLLILMVNIFTLISINVHYRNLKYPALMFNSYSDRVFQDQLSLDWGASEQEYLYYIADCKGGSVEDRCFSMLVILNRINQKMYCTSIIDEVQSEVGIIPEVYIPSEESKAALKKIIYDHYDNSYGITYYR